MSARHNEPPHHVEENIDAILDFMKENPEIALRGDRRS